MMKNLFKICLVAGVGFLASCGDEKGDYVKPVSKIDAETPSNVGRNLPLLGFGKIDHGAVPHIRFIVPDLIPAVFVRRTQHVQRACAIFRNHHRAAFRCLSGIRCRKINIHTRIMTCATTR